MNEGLWPFENLAVEDAYAEHSSYPANPTIDNGLFFAGAMDTWGQGFMLIKEECEKVDAPLPEIKATDKYVTVTIRGCRKYMELLGDSDLGTYFTTTGEEGGEESGEEKQRRLIVFCGEPRSKAEIQSFLELKSERYVREELITPLLKRGDLRRTIPNQPRNRNQQYVTTKTEIERTQAIMDNNPVLEYSPGDLKREGKTVDEYLEQFKENDREFYKEYYSEEL